MPAQGAEWIIKMKDSAFLKSKAGELCIAGIVTLCAFPVTQIAFKTNSTVLCYVSVAMIAGGMLFSPLRNFVFKRK